MRCSRKCKTNHDRGEVTWECAAIGREERYSLGRGRGCGCKARNLGGSLYAVVRAVCMGEEEGDFAGSLCSYFTMGG
jgi:hypothetical protein